MLLCSVSIGVILLVMNVVGKEQVNQECKCPSFGEVYDFCFRNTETNSTGHKFHCGHAEYLQDLALLPFEEDPPFVPVTLEELNDGMVFVTAFTQSHYEKGRRLMASIRKVFKTAKIIVYDLGMDDDAYFEIKDLCNVELRDFNFMDYPSYVANIGEFRWKPLIIAEVLKDHRYFWYADSSVIFRNAGMMKATKLFTCNRTDVREYPRDLNVKMTYNGPLFFANMEECIKSSLLTYSFAGHGTWAATGEKVYRFLPPNFEKLKHPYAKMMDAGLISVIDDERMRNRVLKWWVLCALEQDCMTTRFIRPTCHFDSNNPYTVHAGCHRYDQSVLNLLLSMEYGYMTKNYAAEFHDFFKIDREYPLHPINSTVLSCDFY